MSAYDDLFAAVVQPALAEQRSVEVSTVDLRRIAAALETARASEGRPLPEQYWLPDYPGQTTELKVDGVVVGSHGLVVVDQAEVYEADIDVDGAALPLSVRRRKIFRGAGDERGDIEKFGRSHVVGAYIVRCGSRAAIDAMFTDDFVSALVDVGGSLVDVQLVPVEGKTRVRVRVKVSGATAADDAIALSRATFRAAAVVAPKGFVPTGDGKKLDDADVLGLVRRVRDATSFLAGDVERVGDGVEARLELDAPTDLEARLRIELVDKGVRVFFRGALPVAPSKSVKLTPEIGLWKRVLGLVDPKLGDDTLDDAFLIEGDVDTARLVLTERHAALRLAGRGATLSAGEEGVGVVVDPIPSEDEAVLDVVIACIACWKETALACAGFRNTPDASSD